MTSQAQSECDQYRDENYFGACPECGRQDGCLNIGKSHWFFCRRHKTRWSPGSNLFGSWRYETEAQQRERAAFLYKGKGYLTVEPIFPTNSPDEDLASRLKLLNQLKARARDLIGAIEEIERPEYEGGMKDLERELLTLKSFIELCLGDSQFPDDEIPW